MVSLSFETVGNVKSIKLQEAIKGAFKGGDAIANSPEIQVWDPEKGGVGDYDHYYFWSASKPAGYSNYWAGSNLKPQWAAAQNITIDLGKGVWFRCYEDCTITCAGQVSEATFDPIATKAGKWNLIANPYPVALVLNNNVNWYEAGLRGGDGIENAPEIQVWDPVKGGVGDYDHYYFWTASKPVGYSNYWATSNLKPQYKADLAVPVGRGFWLKYSKDKSSTGGDLTFTFTR